MYVIITMTTIYFLPYISILICSLFCFISESTAPQNFKVTDITNTSATFSWDSPLDANGIITSYTITLNASGFADLSMIITNLTEPLEVSFEDLPPFVDHTATIFATNGFGDGVSTSLDFTTLTGSKQCIVHVHVFLCVEIMTFHGYISVL